VPDLLAGEQATQRADGEGEVTSHAMYKWSDGRLRNYAVSESQRVIVKYFEDAREEELLRLKWDNEEMRKELAQRRAKAMAASA
jgi:hypothetical protein